MSLEKKPISTIVRVFFVFVFVFFVFCFFFLLLLATFQGYWCGTAKRGLDIIRIGILPGQDNKWSCW